MNGFGLSFQAVIQSRRSDARHGEGGEPVLVRTLTGHTNWVLSVAFGSVDGSTVLATASWDHTARLWDAVTGIHLQTLTGHTDWVISVAFGSVDGSTVLATASWDHSVRLWDPVTGIHLHTPHRPHRRGPVCGVRRRRRALSTRHRQRRSRRGCGFPARALTCRPSPATPAGSFLWRLAASTGPLCSPPPVGITRCGCAGCLTKRPSRPNEPPRSQVHASLHAARHNESQAPRRTGAPATRGPHMTYDLFISYAHADDAEGWVTFLRDALVEDHARYRTGETLHEFFDVHSIRTMDDWEHHIILRGLQESRLCLAVLSPAWFKSPFCRRELREYLDRRASYAGVR